MADPNFKPQWDDEATQCKNCKMFQERDGKHACVPPDKDFDSALKAFGEIPPGGHCDFFAPKA